MRIALPCTTIAAITSAWGLVSADDGRVAVEEVDGADDGVGNIASSWARVPQLRHEQSSSDGEECDTSHDYGGLVTEADVGILHCGPGRTCVADVTSSVGGRCMTVDSYSSSALPSDRPVVLPRTAIFPSRDAQMARRLSTNTLIRRVQEDEVFVCPTNCPQSFCDCARGSEDANIYTCASEVHSSCINGLIPECTPANLFSYYTETACPFAACVVSGGTRENCECEFYKDYCVLYYSFQESIESCAIGSCCDTQPEGEKYVCIPELQPTGAPTLEPTDTRVPTGTPTISAAPTISPKPTISPPPSSSPTISFAPTVSPAPTPLASEGPSAAPTISPEVSTIATFSPTAYPTGSPTVTPAPTISPPPTTVPSVSPAPTISPAPTVSHAPTVITVAPTESPQYPSSSPIATPLPTGEELSIKEEDDAVELGTAEGGADPSVVEVAPPPLTVTSGGSATNSIAMMATFTASLLLGLGVTFLASII
ncbi:hypothetical protein ACHAXA_008368 [Cyclostephanos tholiformis]|uniref:Uncharacterized protein n=1 Tax=Cyclostephanos tholiformis TaxID=382380 RepID=A0ABD3RW04_9STRA